MAVKCKECAQNMNSRGRDEMQIAEEIISCEGDRGVTEDRSMLCS